MSQKETTDEIEAAFELFKDINENQCITADSLMNVALNAEEKLSIDDVKEMLAAANEGKQSNIVTKDDFKYIIRKGTTQ